MSKFRILNAGLTGVQHIDQCTVPDTISRLPNMGGVVQAVDPYWGGGEFVYCYFPAAVRVKGLVQFAPVFDAPTNKWQMVAAEVANVANTGRPLGVAVMPAGAGTYGWVQISGVTLVNSTAAVAASTVVGITGVGQMGANSAGKQINSALTVNQASSSITVAKNVIAGNYQANSIGSTLVMVQNTDGWFVGGYVSGTGIPAGTTIAAIDVSEQYVTLSAALTAQAAGAITCTYNNAAVYYNAIMMDRPQAQGAIT